MIRSCPGDMVLDLRDVEFMDSAGLQLLLSTEWRLSGMSRQLTVVCDDGPVRRVIELSRLDQALHYE